MTRATPDRPRLVVLASGRGSNLQAIAAAIERGALDAEVVAVVSDRADAGALAWAAGRGIATVVMSPRDFPDRAAYGRALGDRIAGLEPRVVVLAGFMRILDDGFVNRFEGRLLNIHPSLLPRYPGLHTHRRALEAGDREHGASVHFVTPELDGGPVVIQAKVPVLPGDDEASLAARVLVQEHVIYPRCVGWIAAGRLELRGGMPWFDGAPLVAPVVIDATAATDRRPGSSHTS
jgi:phosphoribosylglycinamide formyltransferase-1